MLNIRPHDFRDLLLRTFVLKGFAGQKVLSDNVGLCIDKHQRHSQNFTLGWQQIDKARSLRPAGQKVEADAGEGFLGRGS